MFTVCVFKIFKSLFKGTCINFFLIAKMVTAHLCLSIFIQYGAKYYSHFMDSYSTIFWIRVTMITMLVPMRIFFNACFYPLLSEYFMIGYQFL